MQINVQLITRLPKEIRREFKAACSARGETMRSVVLAAVRRHIERHRRQQEKIQEEIERDAL